VLKASGGHGATVARYGLRRLLVAAQVALSFVLLAGALLFTRSLSNLNTVETGFDQRGVLILGADLRKLELPAEKRLAAHEDLLERVRAVPGVAAAGSSTIVPVSGDYWNHDVVVEGKKESQNAFFSRISPGYFDTMKMRLLAGRDFRREDRIGAPTAAIVNQKLAAQMFPGQNPVGRRLVVEASSAGAAWTIDIVGMVQDSKYGTLREERQPVVYVAAGQDPEPAPYLSLVLLPSGPLPGVVAGVKKAVAEASPRIVIDIDQLERVIRDSLVRERLMATLSGFFGLLAGLLAAVGLYGVVAYSVARRTHEIGIRMALGADRRRIAWMIAGETAALVGVGLAVGIPLALAATRAAGSMLYGLRPHDPVTFGMAAALLALVAMIAAAIPARRAASVQPMMALKEE